MVRINRENLKTKFARTKCKVECSKVEEASEFLTYQLFGDFEFYDKLEWSFLEKLRPC